MPEIYPPCPRCSRPLDLPAEEPGKTAHCQNCGCEIPALAAPPEPVPIPPAGTRKCGICLTTISDLEERTSCPACGAEYHADCWRETGGCAVYGCAKSPVIEQRQAIEIPMSYWGRENKLCPNCHREILAAAVRCRHCGTTFESARPQEANEFQQRSELKERLPAVRRTVIWLFVFSVLPFLAPIGAVWGAVWYPAHREELRALPSLYGALGKIGLAVAIIQTVAVVVLTLIFSFVRH